MVLNCDQIRALLPHRYPFLLLDAVTELKPGESAVGIKNVTVNEPFFQGHFPTTSVMPGALIIEALAQLTAVVYCTQYLGEKMDISSISEVNTADKVGYLAAVKNFKFKSLVVPGDQLVLRAEKTASLGNISNVNVWAYVKNNVVAEGKISVSQK